MSTTVVKHSDEQCALVVLKALDKKGERRGKELTRARISVATLKKLANRETVTPQWIDQINEWLLSAGWMLIRAPSTYAAIKVSVIENWPRVASKLLAEELEAMKRGAFDFKTLSHLLKPAISAPVDAKRRISPTNLRPKQSSNKK